MKIAIMQPYLFPYIGYFQLIKSVDKFVVYDDVNYIKQGWINRNRILLNNKDFLLGLNLEGASSFKLINEINVGSNTVKILKTIEQAYLKAPFYLEIFPLVQSILLQKEQNLARYIYNQLSWLCQYLDIKTEFVFSSTIDKDNALRGQDKVISICKKLGGHTYVNSSGGQDLYSKIDFSRHQLDLLFVKSRMISYPQYNNEFIPWLSIIDVLMFNSKDQVKLFLDEYDLI
jgi:hypothetical protein